MSKDLSEFLREYRCEVSFHEVGGNTDVIIHVEERVPLSDIRYLEDSLGSYETDVFPLPTENLEKKIGIKFRIGDSEDE